MADLNENSCPTPGQKRFLSFTLMLLAVSLVCVFAIGAFLLLIRMLSFLSDVIWPLAVAGILSLLLRPIILWEERKLHLNRVWAMIVLTAMLALAGSIFVAIFLPVILEQMQDFIQGFPKLLDQISTYIGRYIPLAADWMKTSMDEKTVREFIIKVNTYIGQIFSLVTGLVVIPVYLLMMLYSDHNPLRDINEQFSFIPVNVRAAITFLATEFTTIMVAFFHGQMLVSLIMGLLMALGFTFFGLKLGMLLGILMGFLNIIPYLGTGLGTLAILPLAYLQQGGGWMLIVQVLGVITAVNMLEGYVITPRVMNRRTGLHPFMVILSLFFWGKIFGGILGMVLAIPLSAFFIVVWRLIRKKFLDTPKVKEALGSQ